MAYDELVRRIAGRRVVFDQCVDARFVMAEKLRALGVECAMLPDPTLTDEQIVATVLKPNDVMLTRDVQFIETLLKDKAIHVPQRGKYSDFKWCERMGIKPRVKITGAMKEKIKRDAAAMHKETLEEKIRLAMLHIFGRACPVCGDLFFSHHDYHKHIWGEHSGGTMPRSSKINLGSYWR